MEEGLLLERKGKLFPYDSYTGALYGFNNFYGATCRVACGGPSPTAVGEDPEKDIMELNIVGLTVKPEDLKRVPDNKVSYLYDEIDIDDYEALLNKIEKQRSEPDMAGVNPIKKYNHKIEIFECLNRDEVIKILRDLSEMPHRIPSKKPAIKIESIIFKARLDYYYPYREQGGEKDNG